MMKDYSGCARHNYWDRDLNCILCFMEETREHLHRMQNDIASLSNAILLLEGVEVPPQEKTTTETLTETGTLAKARN